MNEIFTYYGTRQFRLLALSFVCRPTFWLSISFFWLIYNHCHRFDMQYLQTRPYRKQRFKKFAGTSRDLSCTITILWIVFPDTCSIRSCFRLLYFANGLAHISKNSAFVIQFHTNYVRINYNKICVLEMLRNHMSHFSGNGFQPIKYIL